MKSTLRQTLFGLDFKNPVMAASGTFGYGEDFKDFFDVSAIGGFVTKSVTPDVRTGNPPPRIIETPSGMLNAIGLQNPGLNYFIEHIIPRLSKMDTNVFVNVAGRSEEDYLKVCRDLERFDTVHGYEINISCPNVKEGGIALGSSARTAGEITEALRKVTSKPLVVKLSPNVTDIAEIARAVEDAGADGISLINTITGMVVDVERRRPMLANVTGGLSGPALRPVAVRMVYQVARAVTIPVIGIGGIFSSRDALEFIIAGASLVQVGCGMFVQPTLPVDIVDGIEDYINRHEMPAVSELVGSISIGDE